MNKKNIVKSLLLIFTIIFFCSILTRVFSGSETLLDYAAKNPETAYRQPAETQAGGEAVQPLPDGSTGQTNAHRDRKAAEPEQPDMEDTEEDMEDTKEDISEDLEEEKTEKQEREEETMKENPDRVEYQQGFYYEPLSEDIKKRITGVSYPVVETDSAAEGAVNVAPSADDIQITYDELRYVSIQHFNFKGIEKTGELICNKAIAQDLVEIFYELYMNQYQIEQLHLIDEYGGDDTLSMQDNNTSCFNYRVVDGTTHLSKHALGLAIDINPFFNPYVEFNRNGETYISPQGSEAYADRSKTFAYKIDENDLCYRLFKDHGFTWGGDWNSMKDYQHFQKTP